MLVHTREVCLKLIGSIWETRKCKHV